jgi:uncharacterized protein Smg (DUF494 family)
LADRILEILTQILSLLEAEGTRSQDLSSLTKSLLEEGYTAGEITTAFMRLLRPFEVSWVDDRTRPPGKKLPHRILSNTERYEVSTEAYGFLMTLREQGIVDDLQTEEILQRVALSTNEPAGLEEIREAAVLVLMGIHGDSSLLFEDGESLH